MKNDAHSALDTLFHPFVSGALSCAGDIQRAVFLNAHMHEGLAYFEDVELVLQQYFKPEVDRLSAAGLKPVPDVGAVPEECDLILALLPKSQTESLGIIGTAIQNLRTGGVLCVAAGSKSGGNRIAKHLKSMGIEDIQQETKNRARVVWAQVQGFDHKHVAQVIEAARAQEIGDGAYHSHPGIYGWDKIDKGSALLAQYLPEKIVQNGADFGCGYGFLSIEALKKMKADTWHCIDADWRAVEACKTNMETYGYGQCQYYWSDLAIAEPPVFGLDIIAMNPPFHEGQKGNPEMGNAFIRNSSKALKSNGELWLVANSHLPYERALEAGFSTIEKCAEEQGFKVYKAVK